VREAIPKPEEDALGGVGYLPSAGCRSQYRTIDTKAEPGRLEFSHSQRNVPGLLVPIYGPTGEVVLYQSRPDEPRIDKRGRPGTVAGQKVTSGNVHWFHRMQSGMVERVLQEKKTAEFRADRRAGARRT
jgi:hypothetical protein